MRPQRNAGENAPRRRSERETSRASMRPQRNAGENEFRVKLPQSRGDGFNEAPAKCRGKPNALRLRMELPAASMRPQRNAGENLPRTGPDLPRQRASMRPQRNAGENRRNSRSERAAARASMRPQRNAGENDRRRDHHGRPGACFNEAPAKCRGKRTPCIMPMRCASRFNEAPAKCRGKRMERIRQVLPEEASMRPQRNAGENEDRRRGVRPPRAASMRPQRNAGENPVVQVAGRPTDQHASMRPQRNAGENLAASSSADSRSA